MKLLLVTANAVTADCHDKDYIIKRSRIMKDSTYKELTEAFFALDPNEQAEVISLFEKILIESKAAEPVPRKYHGSAQ